MNLAEILKDSSYKLSQFTAAEIEQLEETITIKPTKTGGSSLHDMLGAPEAD